MLPYQPTPLTDFSRPDRRQAMQQALSAVRERLGERVDLRIGGEAVRTPGEIVSLNPSRKDQIVGRSAKADRALAERALEAAWRSFETWRRVPPTVRARLLFKAAAIMERRRLELAAWMVFEVGKSWVEADADVAEAIDFLAFYGREMLRLSGPQPLTPYPGEDNEFVYVPLGAGLVIPPWNFPLAIAVGMTAAAIVAGNTVVLKPASTAPIIAARFVEILEEAGLPGGTVNFLPGPGQEVGDQLVAHPRTRFISFTGSREVGLGIHEQAFRFPPGQRWIKRVVAEMGGKNATLVDQDADLDAAAQAIVAGAFGFQGQKCSASSRVVAHQRIYDELLERVRARTLELRVGDPAEPEIDLGGVIDANAQRKILEYIGIGKGEGRLVAGGAAPAGATGFQIQPTIFADIAPRARIAQEEIFGPVTAFIQARDFDDMLRIANDTDYGLTGALFSRDRDHLERARADYHVGNLYLNRKCTGALVDVHPFGGFNMSGTDSKAGGRDYLLLFMQGKAISEKL